MLPLIALVFIVLGLLVFWRGRRSQAEAGLPYKYSPMLVLAATVLPLSVAGLPDRYSPPPESAVLEAMVLPLSVAGLRCRAK